MRHSASCTSCQLPTSVAENCSVLLELQYLSNQLSLSQTHQFLDTSTINIVTPQTVLLSQVPDGTRQSERGQCDNRSSCQLPMLVAGSCLEFLELQFLSSQLSFSLTLQLLATTTINIICNYTYTFLIYFTKTIKLFFFVIRYSFVI